MPRPERIQYEYAFYHVMNRGRGRQQIFHGKEYYEDFLGTLEEAHGRFDAIVHAYCLMGNHYHLLLETPRANLDRIMRHINGVYTQRYNRRKRTDGPLFRGRYKAILVDEDAYLLEVSRYIHRNPAEIKGADNGALAVHPWSSYLSYINIEPAPAWLCRERTYETLGRRDRFVAYRDFVLQGNVGDAEAFYGKKNIGSILGDKSFRCSVLEEKEGLKMSDGRASTLYERPDMEAIVKAVAAVYDTEPNTITAKLVGRQVPNVPRRMAMYCCQRLGNHSLMQIARYFSLTNVGSVSSAIGAMKNVLEAGECVDELRRLEGILALTK